MLKTHWFFITPSFCFIKITLLWSIISVKNLNKLQFNVDPSIWIKIILKIFWLFRIYTLSEK